MVLFLVGIFAIPVDQPHPECGGILHRLYKEVNWVGQGIASTSLALFSIMLAMISSDLSDIRRPATVTALISNILLAPTFILWVRYREQNHKAAPISNSLWHSRSFTALCIICCPLMPLKMPWSFFAAYIFRTCNRKPASNPLSACCRCVLWASSSASRQDFSSIVSLQFTLFSLRVCSAALHHY